LVVTGQFRPASPSAFKRLASWGFLFCSEAMQRAHRIGILYSASGPYAALGRECRDGAQLAVEQCGRVYPGLVEPIFVDPQGNLSDYLDGARCLLRDLQCRHIIGTVTSAARKEIIPVVEKHDGLLWYTCPYEGFEANANVVYTGACPNQHLIPLFDYLLPRYGKRPFLAGANYVWGWEMNRLARELIMAAGGEIAGERYLPIEEVAVERLVAEVERVKPDFILNNLIGPSSYAFFAAMRELAARDSSFAPEQCPIVSCDLSECELGQLGENGVGHLAAACYFDGLDIEENRSFHTLFEERFGQGRRVSSIFAGAYASVKLCIETIHAAGTDEPLAVRQSLYSHTSRTILGPLRIDAETHHAALPFHLGRINSERGFDIVSSLPAIAADPYLTSRRAQRRPQLRVVS
jgi:urea transport system substrate-binding protein